MTEEVLKLTKLVFTIHFIAGVIFAILYWIPMISLPLFGVRYTAELGAFSILLGAAATGLTISSLLSILAKEWKQVRIVIVLEIVWLALGLVAIIINILNIGLIGPIAIVVFLILLVLFVLAYLKQEEIF